MLEQQPQGADRGEEEEEALEEGEGDDGEQAAQREPRGACSSDNSLNN